MLAVHHAAPFLLRATFWEGAAAFAVVFTGFLKWAWPPIRTRWVRWRNWTLVRDGKAAIPNISPAVLSIPVRLKNLDDGQLTILSKIDDYTRGHDVAVGIIATSVEEIKTQVHDVSESVKKTLKNGLASNDTGDMIYRMGEKLGVVVDEAPPNHDRRVGDEKA